MAQQYSSLQTDWGEPEYPDEIPTLDSARNTQESRLDFPARQFLEASLVTNPYHGSGDTRLIPLQNFQNNLEVGTSYAWYRSQIARDFSGGDAYDVSEQHSDPTHATASQDLQQPGLISVESDLRGNSAWVDGSSNSVADPGFFAPSTGTSSSDQYLDPATYDASLVQLDVAHDASLDTFSEHLQPGPLPDVERPWYPGSRLDLPHDFPIYRVPSVNRSNHDTDAHGAPSSVADYNNESAVHTHSLHPPTVSSEAIGSTRSESKQTYTTTEGDSTFCNQCGARFTGRYQSGNAARHYRQQHIGKDAEVNQACVCRACNQHFKRPDARRKHEWRKHGLEDTKPLPRRHDKSSQGAGSYTGKRENVSDQGTVTHSKSLLEEPARNMLYQVPDHRHRAYRTFADAKLSLGDVKYDYFCKVLLKRCEWIMQWLNHQRSDMSHVFDQELRDLSFQLQFRKHSLSRASSARGIKVDGQNYIDLHDEEDANDPTCRGKNPVARRMSRTSSRFKPYPEHRSKRTEPGHVLATLESFKRAEGKDLDCPIHKWHLVHHNEGLVSPCNGCAKPYMNGVRQHLLPTYSQQHRGTILFIQRCETCKEDIVDEQVWRSEGHGADSCQARSQPQGNSLISWARLYLKIYPADVYVPSPYWNDSRYLPDDLVIWLRNDLGLPQLRPPHPPQHFQTPLSISQDRKLSRHGLYPYDDPTRLESFEAGLERSAMLDTLALIASDLLAYILARELNRPTSELLDVESLVAYNHTRVQQLREESLAQINSTQKHPNFEPSQSIAPSDSYAGQQAHAPVIGGAADFTTPAHNSGPDPFVSRVQISDSDMATQYSSLEHQTSDVSFGYPSSQTSPGFRDLVHADPASSSDTYFCTPSDPTDCPPSSYNHGQWLSPYDAYLDLPGSSRMPQVLAASQMFSDVDYAMASSPTESRYALSHACADEIRFRQFDAD